MSLKTFKGGLNFTTGNCKPLEKRKTVKDITPEKIIQRDFFFWKKKHLRDYPLLNCLFAVPNGIWTFKSFAAEMVRQGLTSGIQDVICLAPSHDKKYPALLIEFKTEDEEKSVQSDEQLFFHNFFAELGYHTVVCRSWEDAADLVIEHLNLTLRKPVRRG